MSMPLPMLDYPWQDVSVDFVLGLPKTIRKMISYLLLLSIFQRWPIFCHADAFKIA